MERETRSKNKQQNELIKKKVRTDLRSGPRIRFKIRIDMKKGGKKKKNIEREQRRERRGRRIRMIGEKR